MDPASYAKAGTERAHQVALFMWASQNRDKYPELKWMFAVPNGGLRDKVTASRMVAEGVRSGVSDIMLPTARCGHHGLFIELKAPGKLKGESEKQKEFGAHVKEQGYYYACLDNWGHARDLISNYLDGTLK